MKKNRKVTFHCEACDQPFEVEQGSRQRYCPDCMIKRITAGKRIADPKQS